MRLSWPLANARPFAIFIVTGGIAALVNILSRIALNWIMPFPVAVVFAYLAGMVTAYVLAKYFVFERRDRPVIHEFARFTLVNVVALAQVWIVSVLLAEVVFPGLGFTWHAETVAHVIGVLSPVVTSYILHDRFTFAR